MAKNPRLLNIFKFSFDDSVWQDSIFVGITDDQLEDLIEFVAAKDITNITAEESYYFFLKAKSEIYWKLATSTAPLYAIEVDGTKVDKNQRFEHYLQLITQVDLEIKRYQESGLVTPISVGEVYLNSRHHSSRNYALTSNPVVTLNIDNVYDTKVEISWTAEEVTKFYNYIIYISNNNIIDNYMNRGLGNYDIANKDATLVRKIFDIKQTTFRIEDLTPNTNYHIAVVCFNANSVFGYKELEFTTLSTTTPTTGA
jgi:hypothetical protein